MLKPLTSFRFFAALMVFMWHIGFLEKFQLGPVGVSFFFVLSGFILAANYHSKIEKLNTGNIKRFYIARLAKIYPVHVLTFFLATPLVLIGFHPKNLYLIKLGVISAINLFLLQSYIPGYTLDFNLVSWSLSAELLFYLLCPFIIWIFMKMKIKSTPKAVSLLTLVWLVAVYATIFSPISDIHLSWWFYNVFPFFRVLDFISGILLGLTYVYQTKRSTLKSSTFSVIEISALILLVVWIFLSPNITQTLRYSVYYIPVWCLLIYTFAFQRGVFSKAFSNSRLVYLGEISFSFYMVHDLVIRYLDFFVLGSVSRAFIAFVISISLSAVIYTYFEEPLRKRIRFGITTRRETIKSNAMPNPNA
ncbi:hypothetical protein PAECIP111891_00529 [Paenibacillus allorhizoplanae]|uniref:Acyltransferase 3 domain-containing protein n=1 Tax=Paenibacillus allorhizoplanae TaxID=2905648 RepID=A0ABN8G0V9_9BACL|nr:acyltransferase [Paenibacillus allorhizoplanae]CAH1194839.1 hypothetical protein PAECIP111891_00529 [Paenibacillus allorhizoplanae]